MIKFVSFTQDYISDLVKCLNELDLKKLEKIVDVLLDTYRNGRKVFVMGNGGSASLASHFACDLSKGTLQRIYDESEKRFKVYALTDNVAILTAYANDCSFEDVFVQQLRNLVDKKDVVIVISGSGNSRNLINAIKYAQKCKAKTIGFLGFGQGGRLGKMVDLPIIVRSRSYGICEDIQLIISHIITSWIGRIKKSHDGKYFKSL
ncbi:SIS domain-containing protein [Candidatus Gottesmanbacteria bacterium]|nr:SIS domain-containing protein [Candidatus Gottesmanbacteria bacterium]